MYSHLVCIILSTQVRKIKKTFSCMVFFVLAILLMPGLVFSEAVQRRTHVEIVDHMFYINGTPTYPGRVWIAPTGEHYKIEGLLMNSRMVQGIFDDLNPETRERWVYPDTNSWDADRNTREFIAAMPEWRKHGMLAFTLNLQGGSPEGYSKEQPWHNSTFTANGLLRPDYMNRLELILDRADELGMVVILGYFYFGQDDRLKNEAAVIKAVDNATTWLLENGYRNVIVEVNNECDVGYDHDILQPNRVHELIERIQNTKITDYSLYAGTSYGGGKIPDDKVIKVSDFILLHGNNIDNPDDLAKMVSMVRKNKYYTPKPILFNEDDNYDLDKPWNNYIAAISKYASWGFFDWRRPVERKIFFGRSRMEPWSEGFQSVPVDWNISTQRKKGFFNLTSEITGVKE
jgi:hypothetical protein